MAVHVFSYGEGYPDSRMAALVKANSKEAAQGKLFEDDGVWDRIRYRGTVEELMEGNGIVDLIHFER